MHKIIITHILVLLITFNTFSQQRFLQIHSDHVTAQVEINDVIADKNSYFVLGSYQQSVAYNQNVVQSASRNQFLMKIDADGSHRWTKTFGDVNLVSTRNFVISSRGSIYLSGLFSDSLYFDNYALGTSHPFQEFLVELDSLGDFKRSIPIQVGSKRNAIFFLFEYNNRLVAGFKGSDSITLNPQNTYYPDYYSGDFVLFAHFDTSGNVVKVDKIESKYKIGRVSANKSAQGNIIVNLECDNSDTLYFNTTPKSVDTSTSVVILEVDSGFNIVNKLQVNKQGIVAMKYHGFSDSNEHLFAGSFTGSISKDSYSVSNLDFPPNTVSLGDGFALILKDDFSISKLFSLGVKGNNLALTGILSKSQQYLVSGSTAGAVELNGDTIVNESFSTSFLAGVDEFTNLRDINYNTGNPPIPSTRNSGMIEGIYGEIVVFGSANSDITFTRSTDTLFRRCSRVGFIWFFDSYLDLEKFQSRQQALSLYPNPSHHWVELKIELAQAEELLVEMLSLDGKGQGQLRHFSTEGQVGENNLRYSTAHLVPGLYLLRVRNQQGAVLGQEKLVVH